MSAQGTPFLIVGAGPFGLATAAHAGALGVEHVLVGEPMSFWREHMPAGMLLRSGCEWHLDPGETHTLVRYLAGQGQIPQDAEPLTLDTYLDYARWFCEHTRVTPQPRRIRRLSRDDGKLRAQFDDGPDVIAERVLLAPGFAAFAHVPRMLVDSVPGGRLSHSMQLARPADHAGRRVLVVGGRQSAFESAALLAEAGAREVHVCLRHPAPEFTESDWSWVGPLLERIAADPGWFRGLPESEREELSRRFWREGRLKLEPWLGPRVDHPAIRVHAETRVQSVHPDAGVLRVVLDNGHSIGVDHVLAATGYRVDLARIDWLRDSPVFRDLECESGYPCLDTGMQTSVPGLHITSLPATSDFGLFFAFTAAARASARIVGRHLVAR